MTNDILDAISVKLAAEFGGGFKIYADEDVKQDFKEPCFFIAVLSGSRRQVIGSRYSHRNIFDVHYFPAKRNNNVEMLDMADKLYDALEYITLADGDMFRSSGMNDRINDGVLHFFVQYNGFLYRKEDKENMEELTIDANVKG